MLILAQEQPTGKILMINYHVSYESYHMVTISIYYLLPDSTLIIPVI